MKKNFENIFWLKIFYGCKIISSKTGLNEKKFWEIFLVKNFYGLKIISLKTG